MGNTTEFTLKLNGDISGLQKSLKTIETQMNTILSSQNVPSSLTKTFNTLKKSIDQVYEKTSAPLLSQKDFDAVLQKLGKVEIGFSGLSREISKLHDLSAEDKISMGLIPEDQINKIKLTVTALKEYEKQLQLIIEKRKSLEKEKTNKDNLNNKKIKNDNQLQKNQEAQTKKSALLSAAQSNRRRVGDKTSEEYQKYSEQIKTLQQDLDTLKAKEVGLIATQKSLDSQIKNSETLITSLDDSIQQIQTKSLEDLRSQAEALGIELKDIKKDTPDEEIKNLADAIYQVQQSGLKGIPNNLDKVAKSATNCAKGTKNLSKETLELSHQLKEADEAAKQTESFASRVRQFLGIQGAAQLMRYALRDAIQTITELDKTMTEMAVVTDLGVGDYWDQLPEYSKRASQLGVSINSAYESATLFYQQGLKNNEVIKLSTETLKMARVAGLDAEDATNKMTAALRGFNMELNETSAKNVADVYSELAAITASDVNEISTAMTKTASIASSAGMEFETTAAFLSQIIETTRESAETAGTAMKTVIARFQELKKAPGEIGEVDGEIVDANQIESALRTVGVSLRDTTGQFRDLDDVFLELSSRWNTLDKNTQRYIATIAAGSRQQSRFIAMMSDYGRTQELVNAANTSAGASNRQFEKTLESLEAKMEQLSNAWHEFTMGILDSDLIKFGVDVATKFLEIINSITNGIDGFGSSFTKLIGIVALFKLGMKVFDLVKPKIMEFLSSVAQSFKAQGVKAGENFSAGVKQGVEQGSKKGKKTDKQEPQLTRKQAKENLEAARKKYESMKHYKDTSTRKKGALNALIKAEEEYLKTAPQKWEKVNSVIGKAGTALMGASFAMNLVGQGLEKMGLSGAAEAFEEISQWAMVLGSGLTTINMLIGIFTPLIKGAGKAGEEAGVKTGLGGLIAQMGWAPFLLLVLAITAVAAGIIYLFVSISKNSPEAKLKEANAALDEATTAANDAKEAYDKLGESIDNLGDKYKNLENLKKGTEEWSDAVKDVNNSVLDLIQEYPELASLVKQEGGVLKLDVESDEVKAVLNKYETKSIAAEGAKLGAKIKASGAQLNYDFSQLDAVDSLASRRTMRYGVIMGAGTKNDKILQKAVEELSIAVTENKINAANTAETTQFLKEQMPEYFEIYSSDAEYLAKQFAEDPNALIDFGQNVATKRAERDAYYQAIATNAMASLDLGALTETQLSQIGSFVDNEMAEKLVSDQQDRLTKLASDDEDSFDKEKEDFVKLVYGENYRVDGDEILNEAGEVVREFADSEAWVKEMAAADATMKAAELMQKVPSIIQSGMKTLKDNNLGNSAVFSKALEDAESLTLDDLDGYKKIVNNEETVKAMFNSLSQKEKEAFGWVAGDTAAQEKAFAAYQEAITEPMLKAEEGLNQAVEKMKKIGNGSIALSRHISGSAALGWTNQLLKINPAATTEELSTLNLAFDNLLANLDEEDKDRVASLIDSMDWMDKNAWQQLFYDAKSQGIQLDQEKFDVFAQAGATAANAITKIDFENLAKEINNAYQLLDKIEENSRTYSEEEYKKLVSANSELKDSFVKVGEEYYYVDGTMQDLTDAIEKNTNAVLGEANRQLAVNIKMIEAMEEKRKGTGSVSSMDKMELVNYLSEMKLAAMSTGGDLEEFGIAGLSNRTAFSGLDESELKRMALELANLNLTTFKETYTKGIRAGNIETYAQSNAAAYNAAQAATTSEFADQHAEALLVQAIRSGGVNESLYEQYEAELSKSAEERDLDKMAVLGKQIADSIEAVIEEDRNRDAYQDLIEQVKDAIVELRQKEIDKLSEVNDSINEANDKLISKIQEQIDADRQARDDAEAEKNITDMRSRLAYLGADTSGANSLEMLDLEKELAEAEQDLKDAKIDQAIANLEDANEKATEQRERQIDLLQSQLDIDKENGQITAQAKETVDDSLTKMSEGFGDVTAGQTEMGKLLALSMNWNNMTEEERSSALSGLQIKATDASNYLKDNTAVGAKPITGETGSGETPEEIQNKAITQAFQEMVAGNFEGEGGEREALNKFREASESLGISRYDANGLYGQMLEPYMKDLLLEVNAEIQKVTNADALPAEIKKKKAAIEYYDKHIHAGDFAQFADYQQPTKGGILYFEKTNNEDNFVPGDHIFAYNPQNLIQEPYALSKLEFLGGNIASNQELLENEARILLGHLAANCTFMTYEGEIYAKGPQGWIELKPPNNNPEYIDMVKGRIPAFKSGGLADFTGPAWLDGTKSKPEIILNQKDSANFLMLRDILSEVLGGSTSLSKTGEKTSGDNYYDIDISVEKLNDDYDVEQLADKIRRMIYDDATYRNVNTINLIR